MSLRYVIFILSFALLSSHLNGESLDLGTIIIANVIFRHGDRTPLKSYQNDPHKDESSWPVPFGQLTNLGKQQELMLGRYLRQRYDQLLSKIYSPKDIYVQSTDVDRTLMSAECILAGLYPPVENQIWDELNWMPIPVHTAPRMDDHVLAGKKYCPNYDKELERILTSGEIGDINKQNEQLYSFLTEKSGDSIRDLDTLSSLYDTLYIEELNNKTLPDWTRSVFPETLKFYAEKSLEVEAFNEKLQRLKIGSLLGKMIENMLNKSTGIADPDVKLFLYSGHETTIANLLMSLGVFNKKYPPYSSALFIELRLNTENEYIVAVSYRNTTEEPYILTLPGCQAACPLTDFVNLTNQIIPDNWNDECLDWWERYGYKNNVVFILAILCAVMLMVIISMFVGFVYYYRLVSKSRSKFNNNGIYLPRGT